MPPPLKKRGAGGDFKRDISPHIADPTLFFAIKFSCLPPRFEGPKKLMRSSMHKPVSSLPVLSKSLTCLCRLLTVSCLLCLLPNFAGAADTEVEMPPMPGQVYHAPGKPVTEESQAALPSELKQIDEQIQHDAAVLVGDRRVDNGQAAKAEVAKETPPQTTKNDSGTGMTPALPIALVAAVGAVAVFVLRRRGGRS